MKKIKVFMCVLLIASVFVFTGFSQSNQTFMIDPEVGQID